MKRFERPLLVLIFFAGLTAILWPVGQAAYGMWSQHALRAAWNKSVSSTPQPAADNKTAKGANSRATTNKPTTVRLSSTSALTPAKSRKARFQKTATQKAKPRMWVPTRLIIPDIEVDAIVVNGVDEEALRQGPGHDPRSALPGQDGNCVIAAHRNVYGWWFYRLDKLQYGSLIRLETPNKTYTYQVSMTTLVDENDSSVLEAPRNTGPLPRLTLYTCTLPKSNDRILIMADLVENATS